MARKWGRMNDGVAAVEGAGERVVVPARRASYRRKRWAISFGIVALLLLTLAAAWLARERIADNIIADMLEENGIAATYEIESIEPDRQIVREIVVGDPNRPDLTIERAIIHLRHRWGTPEIGQVEIVRPRLYGAWRDGRLSFGVLDRYLYRGTGEPPALPSLDIVLVDGRARIDSPFGQIGVKAEGRGRIDDGFSGLMAATAPRLAVGDCTLASATLFGKLRTSDGRLSLSGPARLERASCRKGELAAQDAVLELDLTGDADFASVEGNAAIAMGEWRAGAVSSAGLDGTVRGTLREGRARAQYALAARRVAHPAAAAALVTLTGDALYGTATDDLRIEAEAQGNGLRPGSSFEAGLRTLTTAGEGTLIDPLARRFAAVLGQQARGSSAAADLTVRLRDGTASILVPQAQLHGRGGRLLGRVSNVQATLPERGPARLAGNFTLEGPGLPQLSGRMEQAGDGTGLLRLRMAEYRVGPSSLALPSLTLRQERGGGWSFDGDVAASGPLPGGFVEDLRLPVTGRWSVQGGLALWPDCVTPRFASLRYVNLTLERQELRLCPVGGAIVRTGTSGTRIAVATPSLAVEGRLGQTPIRIDSGPVTFAAPGTFEAQRVAVALGPPGSASRFRIAQLDAQVGDGLAGRFADTEVLLNAVPLDIREASGAWRFANGALTLTDGGFRLFDRQENARFTPLGSQGAQLRLADNLITATADLREPKTGRLVTAVAIRHDLASGSGFAELSVPGILFDRELQPADLSRLAFGVVANTRGVVTGSGRIDWNASGVTSSGAFSSDDLDFAAAFGPVRGASGTIRFTDLLALTTAPGQTLRVQSINPGIEVNDGEVVLDLVNGERLAIGGGRWPFMGGTLTMLPVELRLGASEVRRYTFLIEGLDAARFIERMGIGNLSASGIFDGSLSMVFDEAGNGRVEDGLLQSRPPGGNLSYVGELTYEDLSPMANFAFDALRSLDFRHMTITMEGPLAGDIVTTARFDGVTQGAGASRNFITRRIAALPLRFVVNIRAPFARLITSIRSLYDPAFVRDPRELGLLRDDGVRFVPVEPGTSAEEISSPSIQDQASEDMR